MKENTFEARRQTYLPPFTELLYVEQESRFLQDSFKIKDVIVVEDEEDW